MLGFGCRSVVLSTFVVAGGCFADSGGEAADEGGASGGPDGGSGAGVESGAGTGAGAGTEGGTSGATGATGASTGTTTTDGEQRTRQRMVLDVGALAEPLTDFPLLVVLDPDRIDYAMVRSDGSDIRFLDSATEEALDFEIESFVLDGESRFWVRVPQISETRDDLLLEYGGSPPADGAENPSGVWPAHYLGVWHMEQNPEVEAIRDSTSSGYHGASGVGLGTTGQIGDAIDLAEGESIDIGTQVEFDLTGSVTLQAWVRPEVVDATMARQAVRKSGSYGLEVTQGSNFSEPTIRIAGEMTIRASRGPAPLALDTWQQLTGVYDRGGGTLRTYVDGTLGQSMSVTIDLNENANPLRIGEAFTGSIDEVRVLSVPLSEGWIDAEVMAHRGTLIVDYNAPP